MESRHIGSLSVSVVGIGCNNFGMRLDAAGSAEVVHAALESGINFFDTADTYGRTLSEVYLGRALGARRRDVVVATKFGNPVEGQGRGASPDYVRLAVEASLHRLGTDYIDLYQLHNPDPAVPIADTLGALHELVRAGKVREIGCSNFSADQIREAEAVAAKKGTARFVSVQNEYSLIHRGPEEAVLPECERLRLAFLPYFPLASGLLTGKYLPGRPVPTGARLTAGSRFANFLSDQNLVLAERLASFATSRGHTLLELAVSWLLSRKVVASVIAGAMNPRQVQGNIAAASWRLTEAELAEVDAITSLD